MWMLDWLDGKGDPSFDGLPSRALRRVHAAALVQEALAVAIALAFLAASAWCCLAPEAASPASEVASIWDRAPYAANELWLPFGALAAVSATAAMGMDSLRRAAKRVLLDREAIGPVFDLNVYVVGPVSGRADGNRPAFEAARKALLDAGAAHVAIPHDSIPADAEWTPAMAKSLAMLLEADAVAALDDWAGSPGASLEVAFCKEMGIPWRTVGTLEGELARAREGEEVVIG